MAENPTNDEAYYHGDAPVAHDERRIRRDQRNSIGGGETVVVGSANDTGVKLELAENVAQADSDPEQARPAHSERALVGDDAAREEAARAMTADREPMLVQTPEQSRQGHQENDPPDRRSRRGKR